MENFTVVIKVQIVIVVAKKEIYKKKRKGNFSLNGLNNCGRKVRKE